MARARQLVIQALKHFFLSFLEEVLIHVLRGPLIIVALLPLIASTGAWHFLSSTWSALDMQRAAAWSSNNGRLPNVAVVAIDDTGYQQFFKAQSPLDRQRLRELLAVIAEHSPAAQRIAIDLDLSPAPGQAQGQAALDELLLRKPALWVLPAVNSGTPSDVVAQRRWRADLCSRGLSFGLPYVPNEFGYPKLSRQYEQSLADTALQPPGICADPGEAMHQKAMVLSPAGLQTGLMIPFDGDLQTLAATLDLVNADWIVVGGAWGQTDVFGTPFGDRFGVQVHAAALAGALSHEREASHLLSIIAAFGFISLCSVVLKYMNKAFDHLFRPPLPDMVGHAFYVERLQPVLFVVVVFALILLASEGLAILRAQTGFWLPTAIIGSMTLGLMFLTWNWGQNRAAEHESLRHMWQHTVSHPIHMDVLSMITAYRVLRNGPFDHAWNAPPGKAISRRRALLEGVLAMLSLTMQTLMPVGLVIYAIVSSGGH